jgi:hypothetical protein
VTEGVKSILSAVIHAETPLNIDLEINERQDCEISAVWKGGRVNEGD